MNPTSPVTFVAPKAVLVNGPKAAMASTDAAPAQATPSFAQSLQVQAGLTERPPSTASTLSKAARQQVDELPATSLEDVSQPVGIELAAQALLLAEHTLAHRQTIATHDGDAQVADDAQLPASRATAQPNTGMAHLSLQDDIVAQRLAVESDNPAISAVELLADGVAVGGVTMADMAGAHAARHATTKAAGAALIKGAAKAEADAARLAPREADPDFAGLRQAFKESTAFGADLPSGDSARSIRIDNHSTQQAVIRETTPAFIAHMPVLTPALHGIATDVGLRAALDVPVHHAQWGQALSQQVISWAKDTRSGELKAELRLDPPDLGPLRIALTIADGVTSASFASAHVSVRHAVEQALPQLQAALADAGLALGNTHVGEQARPDQDRHAQAGQSGALDGQTEGADEGSALLAPRAVAIGTGLIDTFA
jgi:flagellar hook-length control protein FliK